MKKINNIDVLHSMPGRVRMRVPGLGNRRYLAEELQNGLQRLEGVLWVKPNPACSSLAVGYVPGYVSQPAILAKIKKQIERQKVTPIKPPASTSRPATGCTSCGGDPVKQAGIRFAGLTAVTAGTFIRGTIFKAAIAQTLFSPLGIFTALATWPLVKKAVGHLRQKRFSLDGFLAGSIITAVAMGEALTALEILWIDSGAEFLNTWIRQRSRKAISDILQISSKNTFISINGMEVEVPVEEVQPGDLVVLHTGEKVSVDGVVESGQVLLDESPINGRSELALREKGDKILAGTLVREGEIFVRAQKVGDQTYLSRVVHMVEDAMENQAPVQGVADKLALRLLKLGGLLTLGTLVVTGSFWRAFTVLLVMACPCATVLSASAPISAAINAAARRKILVKGGRYLEEMGQTDVVCFDKTGTLTISEPVLARIVNLSSYTNQELMQLAYTAEMHNFHPLALAVKHKATEMGLEPGSHVVCQYQLGEGVSARLNGKSIHVGNRRYMRRHEVPLAKDESIAAGVESQGLTVAFVALDAELVGILCFANQIRPEAESIIRQLVKDGINKKVMITGEEACTARPVGAGLGMDECHYSVMPEEKAEIVNSLKVPGHKVLMIGDGINDALALAEADIGIAMGAGGSEVAIEAADIALVTDDLEGVHYLRSLSRHTLAVIHQNFWIATGSNLLGLVLGVAGMLSPVAAGLIHIFHTVGILANSSRVLYHKAPAISQENLHFSYDLIIQETDHAMRLETLPKKELAI